MTTHPIDTEALRDRVRDSAVLCNYTFDGEWTAAERVEQLLDALTAADHRATRAESERDEWKEVALQERGAALDLLEQIKIRDARIKAVREVLAAWDQSDHHDTLEAGIRRALDGAT